MIIHLTPYMNGRATTRGVFEAHAFFFIWYFGQNYSKLKEVQGIPRQSLPERLSGKVVHQQGLFTQKVCMAETGYNQGWHISSINISAQPIYWHFLKYQLLVSVKYNMFCRQKFGKRRTFKNMHFSVWPPFTQCLPDSKVNQSMGFQRVRSLNHI